MSDRVAQLLRGCDFVVVRNVLIYMLEVYTVRVNCTILPFDAGFERADRGRFDDLLILKRRQYLPDLCNDLLYSGVRFLQTFEIRQISVEISN